jgi:cholesterol transport system auxiliary component
MRVGKPVAVIGPMLLGLAVSGCSGLLRSDAKPVQIYTLSAAAAGGGAEGRATVNASLRVAHPLAGPGLDTAQIVLLEPDHRMDVYAASAWAADAPALIESLASQTLRASGEWSSVEGAESPFPADYLLQISIRDFEADYTGGRDTPPTVHVTLDCTLGAEDARSVDASFAASGSAAAGANTLGEVVAAFQQATDQALRSMSRQAAAAARRTSAQPAKTSSP